MSLVLGKSIDAKSAVQLIKEIVEKQGRRGSTGGGAAMVGDPNEFWMVEATGHRWAAHGPFVDAVRSMTNFYMAPELKLYESRPGGVERQKRAQFLLEDAEGEITVPLMIRFTRDQQAPPDRAYVHDVPGNLCNEGYRGRSCSGHINMGAREHADFLSVVWYSIESPIVAPYIPFYLGITDIPDEFATTAADELFSHLHLLLYEHPDYRPFVRRVWENLEFRELSEATAIEAKVSVLLQSGAKGDARALLNDFTKRNCTMAITMVNQLIEKIAKETDWTAAK